MQTLDRLPAKAIEVHTVARVGFDEVFVTAAAAAEPGAAFRQLASALRRHRIEPVAEKVYGTLAAKTAILDARSAALQQHGLDAARPCTFVDGAPAGGGAFGGVQLWGVRQRGGNAVGSVDGGRLWQGPTFRVLHLAAVHGRRGETATVQAQQMFATAAAAAQRHGFHYSQTARTWIYVARLLDWYGELNRVRTACYHSYDFALPASTGIQGGDGEHECLMDVLLLDGVPTRAIASTARQGPASAYGSSFSRGVELAWEGGSTVHVSGTASIDGAGRSLHAGDAGAQFVETLLDVAAVLQQAGMGLADIQQATLFCKDEGALAASRQVLELLQVPALPLLCVRADVCRGELLVEMEAVAAR